jgi:zinc D-Ala-D-Ala carboxypeptidase
MEISEHFNWEDVTISQEAARRGIDNSLPEELRVTALRTAVKLEKVRTLLGDVPVHVNSWYRCPELNAAIGSNNATSAHPHACAVDFIAPRFGTPLDICKHLQGYFPLLQYDQLIMEHTWVHIGFKADPSTVARGQVLSLLKSGGYAVGLTDPLGNFA